MRSVLLAGILLLALTGSAYAQGFGFAPIKPSSQCRTAIRAAERSTGGAIPEALLAAIARVESGRRDPETGKFGPWPWTINAEGQGAFFETKAAAIAAVRDLQARGVRSIDVGCMQISLLHHPNAFGSLEQAFDPQANAAYGARFLMQLHDQSGDWTRATGQYHSGTPELAAGYQRMVFAAWPQEKQEGGSTMSQLASAWRSTVTPAQPTSLGAIPLPTGRGDGARVIPLAAGPGGGVQGRGLDAYRAAPIAMAVRVFRNPGG